MKKTISFLLFISRNTLVLADYADHGKYHSVSHNNYGGVFVFVIFIAVMIIRALSNFFENHKTETKSTPKVSVSSKNIEPDYTEGYIAWGCFLACIIIAIFGMTFCH